MADFILGIDAGGTAVKAAVYSLSGDELGVTSQALRPITPNPAITSAIRNCCGRRCAA